MDAARQTQKGTGMIIRESHIDGFGVFKDFSLTSLNKGVNILLGNNEAGKSTLLAFLRYTLFGYPRLKEKQHPPLNGGQHGGRVQAVLHSGREATFERYAGSKGGKIKLLYDGQETSNPSQWAQLLGNASEELYNNVYAFSLNELVHLDSLSKSGVEDKIFSVGLGLGNTSIGDVENSIDENIKTIYKRQGQNQLIPKIYNEIKKKREQVSNIQENLPLYQQLKQEIRQLEEESRQLDKQIKELRDEKSRLDYYLKCYGNFLTITRADEALKKLPELRDYPEKGIEKLDRLEDQEQSYLDGIEELNNGTREEKGIGELKEAIDAVDFNASLLEEKDRVEYLRKNLEKYKQTTTIKAEEEQQIRNYEQSIENGIASISGSWDEQNITGFTDIAVHRNKIQEYKDEFDNFTHDKRELDARITATKERESSINIKAIAGVISAILLLGSIPVIIGGSYISGGTLIIMALLLFFGRNRFVKEGGHELLKQQRDDLMQQEQDMKNAYGQYLENQLNLPESLSPESTLKILEEVEKINGEINARDDLKEKVKTQLEPFIGEFEETAKALQGKLSKDPGEENIEMIVAQAIEEFDHATAKQQEKEQLQKELTGKQKALKNSRSKLDQTTGNINELLNSIEAIGREDFRKKYKENEEVKKHLDHKNKAIEAIDNIVGQGKAEEVIDYLNKHDKTTMESRVRELNDEIDLRQKEWKEKNSTLGGKKNEIERIEGESEMAEALTELETARQKLQDAYKEWITGKIALDALNEVKSKYEQEKQPAVIQNSSHYFKKITRGNYEKIRVSLDDQDVAVYDPRGASKKIDQLSRGTREQLLISLRLGFIEEYEKQAEPLPLIVDEVMVNFDPYRAKQTAEILREFGQDRQILIFTCHPDTVDYFDPSQVNITQI